jgi:MFS family permease
VKNFADSRALAFLAPACVALLAVGLFAVVMRERPTPLEGRSRRGSFLSALLVNPRKHPDFAWVWLSRFAFFLAVASVVGYQALYLRHGLDRPLSDIPQLVVVATLVKTTAVILASLACGRLSDRVGRRKPFVLGAGLLFAAGPLVVILSGSYAGFVAGIAITGLAIGTYASVDLALVIDVLPNRGTEAAKDLGVLNLATTLSASVAPALAPLFLMIRDGSYAPLFVAAAVFAALAAAAIVPIRGVR